MKITIPTSLSEITLNQWLHFQQIARRDDITEDFLRLSLVTIFCNLSIEQAKQIAAKDFNDITNSLNETLAKEPQFIQRFTLNGVEYGFIPNLDEITSGEYIDLDKYLQSEDTYYNAMAVMYRPITESKFGLYRIEPYESSERHRQALVNMPLEAALGALVFFYRLSNELLTATQTYLQKAHQQIHSQEEVSPSVGDGMLQSIRLLEDACSSIRRLLNSTYTLSYTILNTE